MDFDDFANELFEDVKDFILYWKVNNARAPEQFPLVMDPGEWGEQFMVFITGDERVKPQAPYGLCPKCGVPGVSRERHPNGNDKCAAGHSYPSKDAV